MLNVQNAVHGVVRCTGGKLRNVRSRTLAIEEFLRSTCRILSNIVDETRIRSADLVHSVSLLKVFSSLIAFSGLELEPRQAELACKYEVVF